MENIETLEKKPEFKRTFNVNCPSKYSHLFILAVKIKSTRAVRRFCSLVFVGGPTGVSACKWQTERQTAERWTLNANRLAQITNLRPRFSDERSTLFLPKNPFVGRESYTPKTASSKPLAAHLIFVFVTPARLKLHVRCVYFLSSNYSFH